MANHAHAHAHAKVTLELDEGGNDFTSLVDSSIADGIENEKCVVSQYRTSAQQKQAFIQVLRGASRDSVPIEWVIDIADESNGWFYATAYSYDDNNQALYVMVPDKENPTFQGHVQLDHRTLHLIECVDGNSMALFNKIVRDSVIKIKWDVEWFEEGEDQANDGEGTWVPSSARYFIRIANQLLVEDRAQPGSEARGFVIITADMNVRLVRCHKNRGIEDFNRLLAEGIVQTVVPDATESPEPATTNDIPFQSSARMSTDREDLMSISQGSSGSSLRKLADTARQLRDNISELLADRERKREQETEVAALFKAFTLDGDLEQGLKLMAHFEKVQNRQDTSKVGTEGTGDGEEERANAAAAETKHMASKLEKYLSKMLKGGNDVNGSGGNDEVDALRKSLKKAKREIEEKEKEIRRLSGAR
jgi:hypothetical protein